MNFMKTVPKVLTSKNSIKIDEACNKKFIRLSAVVDAPESGAGRGSGPGGAIREGGGGLSKMGIAKEEGYFYEKQRQQLQEIKNKLERQKKSEKPIQKKPDL